MKNILIIAGLMMISSVAMAQKSETIVIHTSAECNECEIRLEDELNYTKGVSFAELDVKSQNVTIKYNAKKITPEQIKTIISKLGYDADDVKADSAAQNKLPECCQPGGMHQKEHPEGERH